MILENLHVGPSHFEGEMWCGETDSDNAFNAYCVGGVTADDADVEFNGASFTLSRLRLDVQMRLEIEGGDHVEIEAGADVGDDVLYELTTAVIRALLDERIAGDHYTVEAMLKRALEAM